MNSIETAPDDSKRFRRTMWVWLFTSLLVIFTRPEISVATFVLLLPPIAYFSQFFFTSRQKPWVLNLVMLVMQRPWAALSPVDYRYLDRAEEALPTPIGKPSLVTLKTLPPGKRWIWWARKTYQRC